MTNQNPSRKNTMTGVAPQFNRPLGFNPTMVPAAKPTLEISVPVVPHRAAKFIDTRREEGECSSNVETINPAYIPSAPVSGRRVGMTYSRVTR